MLLVINKEIKSLQDLSVRAADRWGGLSLELVITFTCKTTNTNMYPHPVEKCCFRIPTRV